MSNEFDWVKSRDLKTVYHAMKDSTTVGRRRQYRRLLYRGLTEWTFIFLFFTSLLLGSASFNTSSNFVVASIKSGFYLFN